MLKVGEKMDTAEHDALAKFAGTNDVAGWCLIQANKCLAERDGWTAQFWTRYAAEAKELVK